MGSRLTKILLLAGLALAVTASGGSAASRAHGRISGVVPRSGHLTLTPHLLSKAAEAVRAAVPTALTFDANYQSVINRYFADVAHDSGTKTNVYSVAEQYYADPGHVNLLYQSTVGGSYVDHNPLPANGCSDGLNPYCLTDQQLENEIQAVMTAQGWHGAADHIFFLMTPNGVGSCFSASSADCSTNAFCAYHSYFVNPSNENVIYANEPYEGTDPVQGCSDSTQGFPSSIDADTTINTISHEHNEAITDPLTDNSHEAWIAADQNENGDLCAYGFGTALGGTAGVDAFNQLINGHHYDVQQEWSNADNGCILHSGDPNATPPPCAPQCRGPLLYNGGPVMHTNTTYAIYWLPTARNTARPVVTGTKVVGQTLSTSTGSWAAGGGAPFSYQWQRCSATGTSCADISGATATTYKLTTLDGGHVMRSTVSATNVNGLSPAAASTGGTAVIDTPALTKAPRISGRAKVGKKLTGSRGSWTYAPTSYHYQWLRCSGGGGSCSSIKQATHPTYKLTSRDAKHTIKLRIIAANAAGNTAATSAATARVSR